MDGSYSNSSSLMDDNGVNAKPAVPSAFPQADNDTSPQPQLDAVNAQSTDVNSVHHSRDPSQSSIQAEGSGRIVGSDTDNAEFDLMFNDELYNFFDDETSGSRDFSFDLDYLSTLPLQKQLEGSPEPYPSPSPAAASNTATSSPSMMAQLPKPSQPAPPPGEVKEGALIWHNPATDKQHRESMIILIANLLKARKKVPPSSEWLQQLPHKAKKLERRLYYSAPSLKAYVDRTTIKLRLQALARDIVSQHRDNRSFETAVASFPPPSSSFRASLQHRPSVRTSTTSNASSASLTSAMAKHRSSVISHASIDSLRDLRESVDSKAAIDTTADAMPKAKAVKERSGSASSKRSTGGDSADAPDKKRRQSATSSRPLPPSQNPIVKMSSESVSELERQKAVNARLQEQIMENIRLQEELVRKLQADQGISNSSFTNEPQPPQRSYSAPSSGNMSLNQYGNLFGNASTNTNSLLSNDKGLSNGASTNAMLSSSNSGVVIPQQPLMNQGVGNSLPYQQNQFSSGDMNSFLMNSGVLGGLQQQQPQNSQSFPNMQQVNALQNQFFLQQQQQQQQPAATMAPLGGSVGNAQFQQLQYGMMQQPQLSNLSNFSNASRAMIGLSSGMNMNAAAANPMNSMQMANLRNASQMGAPSALMNSAPNATTMQQQPYNISSSYNTNYLPNAPGSGNAPVVIPSTGNEARSMQPPQQQPPPNSGTADNFMWWK